MIGILRDNENKRMNLRSIRDPVITIQLDRDMVVVMNRVFEFDFFEAFGCDGLRIEVLPRCDRGFFDKTILHRLAQAIAIDHIAEIDRVGADGLRRRRQFQTENGLQALDRLCAGTRAVSMCLIHDQHKIVQPRQIVVIALADRLLKFLHLGPTARPLFFVDFINVENIDVNVGAEQVGTAALVKAHTPAALVILAGD